VTNISQSFIYKMAAEIKYVSGLFVHLCVHVQRASVRPGGYIPDWLAVDF